MSVFNRKKERGRDKNTFLQKPVFALCILFMSAPNIHGSHTSNKASDDDLRRSLTHTAKSLIGRPYKSGEAGPACFDCCGFSMYVYQCNGINIPRTARDQFGKGTRIDKKRLHLGDLLFFRITNKDISHVGLYIGNDKFIHAPYPGKAVRIEKLNTEYWKKRYAAAVTYLHVSDETS